MKNKRYVEYEPPPTEIIDEFAKNVCDKLGESNPEVVHGFARFMRFVSQSVANSMTRDANNEDIDHE